MGKIPEYDIQVAPQTQESVKVNPSDLTSGAQGGTEMMQTLANISKEFYDLRILKEKTKATTDLKIALANIELEATNNPDTSPESLTKYYEKTKSTIDDHLGMISDQTAREQTRLSFELEGQSANNKITTKFRERDIEAQQYETYEAIELNHNIYVTAKTKAEKDKAYNDTVDLLEENVAKGVMTAEKAAQYRNNMRKEWSLDEAYYDARNNKELYDYKRDNGLYKDLYEDDLAKVETYATNLHKKTMDEYKIGIAKAQINTAIDLLDKIDKGKATLEEIDRAQVLGEIKSPDGIDSNVANSFRKMLSTRKQNPDIRLSEYAKLSAESDIFFKEDGSVKTEDVDTSLKKLKVYRDKVLQSAGEGKLNEPDAKQLLEDVGIAANILATQKAESNVETEKRKARKWMWGWKSKYSKDIDVERGRLLQEFNSAINDGKSVAEAQAIAVDRLNIALNDNRTKYIIDNNYKFPKGILRVTGYDDYGDPIFERAK